MMQPVNMIILLLSLLLFFNVSVYAEDALPKSWYGKDKLATELCQLTPSEYKWLSESGMIEVSPVITPEPKYVVGENDYFMWPISTMIDDTMVVLYQRTACHWGPDLKKNDQNGGIRMIITSSDGGITWSDPVDVLAAGSWDKSPFMGCGGALGVHEGILYLALIKGIYTSTDKGRTWTLLPQPEQISNEPLWGPGIRITFDEEHGLIIWNTCGFSTNWKDRYHKGMYGTHLVAFYSPDFGKTWHMEKQALPDGLLLSEVTPVQFDGGQIAFFLRNGLHDKRFGQGYSKTGWFPFSFALTNVGPVKKIDTPDINYNPVTKRLEVAAPFRMGEGPGPQGAMKANLYSMSPEELAAGSSEWRYDGTLLRYRDRFEKSDGFNMVASVIDEKRGKKYFHIWGGDCTGRSGIFQYTVTLQTPELSKYLLTRKNHD